MKKRNTKNTDTRNCRLPSLMRLVFICLAVSLIAISIQGCKDRRNETVSPSNGNSEGEKLQVLCTVFPIYDWARNIIGDSDGVSVSLLLNKGADLHSYQPTVADTVKIAEADLIIHIGGSSDEWVTEAAFGKTPLLTLSQADGITLCSSDSHEGGEEHTHRHNESQEEHHHSEFDEHIWLSPENAIVCSESIANTLSQLDGKNADKYSANLSDYTKKLSSLSNRYSLASKDFENKRLIFADRFPFIYMFSLYGIDYSSAFSGCATDSEANFDVIIRLAETFRAENADCVFVTESSDKRLANTVLSESGVTGKILVLDSLQSVTPSLIENGYSYLGAMEENLKTLKTALDK